MRRANAATPEKKRNTVRNYAAPRHDFGDFAMDQVFELKDFY